MEKVHDLSKQVKATSALLSVVTRTLPYTLSKPETQEILNQMANFILYLKTSRKTNQISFSFI